MSKPVYQQQPGNNGGQQPTWMSRPRPLGNCPPGLEYLTQLDQLLIQQKVELFEAFTDIETKNKYVIKNSLGQQCYYAYEESDLCMRICCKAGRGFNMHIVDNSGNPVLNLVRPFKCFAGCCWCAGACECCSDLIRIEDATGNLIGSINQNGSCWIPWFDVRDADDSTVFKIKGPCCVCPGVCCTCDFPFEVLTTGPNKEPVGRISKTYAGFTKELFTDASNFSLTFPGDLDVKMKGVLLGATFLIDMMFFEDNGES